MTQILEMTALQTLLREIIDYAGLFPPARLPLDDAIHNFAEYRGGSQAWILGRFVCPVAKMIELEAYGDSLFAGSEARPWRFSALGRSGADAISFLTALEEDVAAMARLMAKHGDCVVVDAIETKLPESVVGSGDELAIRKLLSETAERFHPLKTGLGDSSLQVFFEIPFLDDWRQQVGAVIAGIAEHNKTATESTNGLPVGAKMRTGGVQASMIPPVEQVAFFIHTCQTQNVPFKATAGLHHPMRHQSAEVGAKMHGFINVFGGAALGRSGSLPEDKLCELLADESPDHFRFDDDTFCWGKLTASREEIQAVRTKSALSFGSCSVVEPIEDLVALGLL